jgi:hypothetical protein
MKRTKPRPARRGVPHTNNPDYRCSPPRQLKNGLVELDGSRIADAWLLAEKGARKG